MLNIWTFCLEQHGGGTSVNQWLKYRGWEGTFWELKMNRSLSGPSCEYLLKLSHILHNWHRGLQGDCSEFCHSSNHCFSTSMVRLSATVYILLWDKVELHPSSLLSSSFQFMSSLNQAVRKKEKELDTKSYALYNGFLSPQMIIATCWKIGTLFNGKNKTANQGKQILISQILIFWNQPYLDSRNRAWDLSHATDVL